MAELKPSDPDFAARVRASFARQRFMDYLGARLIEARPGFCEIHLDYRDELSQQHGFFHGGVIGALADNAGGYAGYSLMGGEDSVLTVEYKLNILAPGQGTHLIARGRVVRAGRTLTVTRADVLAVREGRERLCAAAQQTLMRMASTADDRSVERRGQDYENASEQGGARS